jgi:gas vesicle protein
MESIEKNINAIRELTIELVAKLTEYTELTSKQHKEHMSKLREMIDPEYRKQRAEERANYRNRRHDDEQAPF